MMSCRGERKVYWLTGASSGIGRAIALQLAQSGHRVFLTARNELALKSLVKEFPDNLIALPCDVTDPDAMQTLFNRLPEAQQPNYLDGIILAAGICEYIDLPEFDSASFRRVIDVNYLGVVHACQSALPLLIASSARKRGKPKIMGLCSMSVYLPFPRAQAYGSAKAAMEYFLQSLRADLQSIIDVTVVYPGFIETPMTKTNDFAMPFAMSAESAALKITSALSSKKHSLYFPWQLHCLLKFAGWIPGLWFGLLAKKISRVKPQLTAGAEEIS